MSHVSPIRGPHAVNLTDRSHTASTPQPTASPTRGDDQADFSVIARLKAQLSALPEVRQNMIDRVRAEIDAGTYGSADKIEAAIDALAEDL